MTSKSDETMVKKAIYDSTRKVWHFTDCFDRDFSSLTAIERAHIASPSLGKELKELMELVGRGKTVERTERSADEDVDPASMSRRGESTMSSSRFVRGPEERRQDTGIDYSTVFKFGSVANGYKVVSLLGNRTTIQQVSNWNRQTGDPTVEIIVDNEGKTSYFHSLKEVQEKLEGTAGLEAELLAVRRLIDANTEIDYSTAFQFNRRNPGDYTVVSGNDSTLVGLVTCYEDGFELQTRRGSHFSSLVSFEEKFISDPDAAKEAEAIRKVIGESGEEVVRADTGVNYETAFKFNGREDGYGVSSTNQNTIITEVQCWGNDPQTAAMTIDTHRMGSYDSFDKIGAELRNVRGLEREVSAIQALVAANIGGKQDREDDEMLDKFSKCYTRPTDWSFYAVDRRSTQIEEVSCFKFAGRTKISIITASGGEYSSLSGARRENRGNDGMLSELESIESWVKEKGGTIF